jgi:hypothetical protein
MAEDERATYTQQEEEGFGRWVELGARDPELQWILDGGLSRRWERREPSGSEWVMELLRGPREVLLEEQARDERSPQGITDESLVSTTILHHHRGLRRRVIVMTVTVEQPSGDVSLVVDKET